MARRCKDCGTEAMPRDRACIRCGTPLPSSLGSFLGGFFQKEDAPHVGLTPKKQPPPPSAPRHHRPSPPPPPQPPVVASPPTDAWGMPSGTDSERASAPWAHEQPAAAARWDGAEAGQGGTESHHQSADAVWGLQGGVYGAPDAAAEPSDEARLAAKLEAMAQRPPEAPAPDGRQWRDFTLSTGPSDEDKQKAQAEKLMRMVQARVDLSDDGLTKAVRAMGRIAQGQPGWPGMPPWVAALSSLWWPGLGQLMQGRVKLAAGFWAGSFGVGVLITMLRPNLEGSELGPLLGWMAFLYQAAVAWEAHRHSAKAKAEGP